MSKQKITLELVVISGLRTFADEQEISLDGTEGAYPLMVLMGASGSGKSTLFSIIKDMRDFVLTGINRDLQPSSFLPKNLPWFPEFDIYFSVNGRSYNYHLHFGSKGKIIYEALRKEDPAKGDMFDVFARDSRRPLTTQLDDTLCRQDLLEKTASDKLYLTTLINALPKHPTVRDCVNFFSHLQVVSATDTSNLVSLFRSDAKLANYVIKYSRKYGYSWSKIAVHGEELKVTLTVPGDEDWPGFTRELSLDELSSGEREFLTLAATILSSRTQSQVILIDNVANQLDAFVARDVLSDTLDNQKLQLWVTTHELLLTEGVPTDNILLSNKNYDGTTEIITAEDAEKIVEESECLDNDE